MYDVWQVPTQKGRESCLNFTEHKINKRPIPTLEEAQEAAHELGGPCHDPAPDRHEYYSIEIRRSLHVVRAA